MAAWGLLSFESIVVFTVVDLCLTFTPLFHKWELQNIEGQP